MKALMERSHRLNHAAVVPPHFVIPAQAGTQVTAPAVFRSKNTQTVSWVPAFAGMTEWVCGSLMAITTQKQPFLTCFKDTLDCVTNSQNTYGYLLRFVPCNRALKTRHKQLFLNRDGYIGIKPRPLALMRRRDHDGADERQLSAKGRA
jgi:hypothetical protein